MSFCAFLNLFKPRREATYSISSFVCSLALACPKAAHDAKEKAELAKTLGSDGFDDADLFGPADEARDAVNAAFLAGAADTDAAVDELIRSKLLEDELDDVPRPSASAPFHLPYYSRPREGNHCAVEEQCFNFIVDLVRCFSSCFDCGHWRPPQAMAGISHAPWFRSQFRALELSHEQGGEEVQFGHFRQTDLAGCL